MIIGGGCNNHPSVSQPTQTSTMETSYVKSVQPSPESSTSESVIKIAFTEDMDGNSLNKNTIQITEKKHGNNVIELYDINYDPTSRILTLSPKNNQYTFGSENTVTVNLSGNILNQKGQKMGSDYTWSFKTTK
jgi:hypothetical protein